MRIGLAMMFLPIMSLICLELCGFNMETHMREVGRIMAKMFVALLLIAIVSACTPHWIVKPPPVTIEPQVAPTDSLLPTITPDLRTPTP